MINEENSPDPVDIHVGRRLRLRREILKLSQEQVANAIGVTFQQIQKYEQGRNRVSSSRMFDLCQILNIPMTYLFQGLDADAVDSARKSGELFKPSGMSAPGATYDSAGMLERTETLELVRSFWRIPNARARAEFLALVKTLGGIRDEVAEEGRVAG